MSRNRIFLITLFFIASQNSFAESCSTVLADCFKKTISNLEAGDPRLQNYEMKAKMFLKDLKKNDKEGSTFNNKSVLLKEWSLIEKVENKGMNVIVLKNPSGQKYAFAWSEIHSFAHNINNICANNEPTEFLTGEVYTEKIISGSIVVISECGITKLIHDVKESTQNH